MTRRLARFVLLALALTSGAQRAAASTGPPILTEDVDRFYKVYAAADHHPAAEQLDRDYLAPGTAGLHEFARLRKVSGQTIAAAIEKRPEIYDDARRCLAALPAVKRRVAAALDKLARIYPEAKFPPVTIVVGRGRPVGITNPSGVTVGLEALCAADFMNPDPEDRFVHVIAHEYGHIQQSRAQQELSPGDAGATVLTLSLIEGAADFVGELISGDVGDQAPFAAAKGHEAQIESEFVRDEDKTDTSNWLYNGVPSPGKPTDLGYWVGYRIVKAYYARAPDKHQALRDIFEMTDPKAFLTRSGWRAGR
ncbi:MAG TPA: DUF2268 domain-containing putative Zn-dependent protease [Rudaea sp.]|nr:DUF2268 domain-containing putative Zn-dependent protease [Rudaea sp.]